MPPKTCSLEDIEVRDPNTEEIRQLLRLLPPDTFRFTDKFIRGLPMCGEEYCGQIGIYAKRLPDYCLADKKGLMLIVVNEHLFGNPIDSNDNPVLKVPDGATNIYLIPPRQPPLKQSHPFAGVEFDYQDARFFFGYELSKSAYDAILKAKRNS